MQSVTALLMGCLLADQAFGSPRLAANDRLHVNRASHPRIGSEALSLWSAIPYFPHRLFQRLGGPFAVMRVPVDRQASSQPSTQTRMLLERSIKLPHETNLRWLSWLDIQMTQFINTAVADIRSSIAALDEDSQHLLLPMHYFYWAAPMENSWLMMCSRFMNREPDYSATMSLALEHHVGEGFLYQISDNGSGLTRWALEDIFTRHTNRNGFDSITYQNILQYGGISEIIIVSRRGDETWRLRVSPGNPIIQTIEQLTGDQQRPHQGTDTYFRIAFPARAPSPQRFRLLKMLRSA